MTKRTKWTKALVIGATVCAALGVSASPASANRCRDRGVWEHITPALAVGAWTTVAGRGVCARIGPRYTEVWQDSFTIPETGAGAGEVGATMSDDSGRRTEVRVSGMAGVGDLKHDIFLIGCQSTYAASDHVGQWEQWAGPCIYQDVYVPGNNPGGVFVCFDGTITGPFECYEVAWDIPPQR